VPSWASRPRRQRCRNDAPEIAGRGFRSPAKRFGVFSSVTVPIAAVQRDWRGFRIAPCSRERDDATLPKIWTPCVVAISRTKTVEASMNQTAVVSKFSHVKLGT
jgi:hypothetical protein